MADILCGEGRDTSEAVVGLVVEGGEDTTAEGGEPPIKDDTGTTLLDVSALLRFDGLLGEKCDEFETVGGIGVAEEGPVGCEPGGGATYAGGTHGFAQFEVCTGRQLVL